MSEFEDILTTPTGIANGHWRTSRGGNWLYVIDGYKIDSGEIFPCKSKKGNPYMIRIHQENIGGFIRHIIEVNNKLKSSTTREEEDAPF